MDRYAYVNNSPMNYVDPSGHAACDDEEGVCSGNPSKNKPSQGGLPSGNLGGSGSDDEDPCDWKTCVNDIDADTSNEFWEYNNDFINSLGELSDLLNIGGYFESGAGLISIATGTPVLSKEFIALVTGGTALLEPTVIAEILILSGVIAQVHSNVLDGAKNNLQEINNEIVRSGMLENGGTITASLTEVTITQSRGETKSIPSLGIGWLALTVWSATNPNLVPTQ